MLLARAFVGCAALLLAVPPGIAGAPTPINVGNFVWNDIDADGVQDANEPGIAGVTVQLWNDVRTDLIASTTTNANGIYLLQAPGPGSYRVRVVLPSASDGFSPLNTPPSDTADSDIIPAGGLIGFTDVYVFASNLISITSIDAGIVRPPIALGDRVWNDYDADGIQDAIEPGIAGAPVELWNETRTLMLLSTTTNASGTYSLAAPGPGNYRIRVGKASGDSYPPADAGNDDTLDSDVIASGLDIGYTATLIVAAPTTSIDGGIIRQPINVGNFVWNDLDGDGVQESGEQGLAGINVQLWNELRTVLLDATTTNASGNYTLQAPGPGNYRVRVVLPSSSDTFVPKDSPPSDVTDSDINPSGSLLGFTDAYTFAPNLISITSIDGGLSTPLLFRDGFE
jgi:hypothetical protein